MPERNAAERQIARLDEGATLARDLRRAGSERGGGPWLTTAEASTTPESDALLAEVAGLDVKQLLMGAASTLASLAYAKLERGDLPQAKLAIDGVAALVPLLEGDLQRDLERALTGLQVAFVDAAKA